MCTCILYVYNCINYYIAEVHGCGVQDMAISLYSESKINFIIGICSYIYMHNKLPLMNQ